MDGLTLVLGGTRSGKSRHAERSVEALAPPWTYVATAEAFDDEMARRLADHRARRGAGWETVEAPRALAEALGQVPPKRPVLVDCLTLWLSNHLLAGSDLRAEADRLVAALSACRRPVWLVASEVGLGIVPETPLGRRFRDEAGLLNQRMAALADRVEFVAAGLPLVLKG